MLMIGIYDAAPSSGGDLILDASPFVIDAMMSTNVHGAESLPFSLLRDLSESFKLYHQAGTPYVGVFEGATLLWEGRLEDPTLTAGSSSGYRGQALGYWRALSDTRYTALWSDTSYERWRLVVDTELVGVSTAKYSADKQTRLYLAPRSGQFFASTTAFGQWTYETPDASTRPIVGVQFDYYLDAPASWRGDLASLNRDFTGPATIWSVQSVGAALQGSVHATFAGEDRITFEMYYNAASAQYTGADGNAFLRITNLRVVTSIANRVNTTLTANRNAGANVTATVGSTANMYVGQKLVINSGVSGASETVTVLSIGSSTQFNATFTFNYVIGNAVQGHRVLGDEIANDMIAAVSALNPSQLSSNTTLIQSPALDLLDEVYEDRTPADILDYLASRGDNQTTPRMWEVGVTEGQIVYFRPRMSASRAWYVDATDLELARSLDQLFNSAYGLYKDPNGGALRTAASTDAESLARTGMTRRTAAPASTTSSTQAGVQRDTFIANSKNPLPRATIRFNAIYDAAGAEYPLWLVRAGDSITVRNVPPSVSSSYDRVRTFRVTRTNYNMMTGTLEVAPEIPDATLAHQIARKSIGAVESPYVQELRS